MQGIGDDLPVVNGHLLKLEGYSVVAAERIAGRW